ncbi:hypothetical protein ACK8NB_18055, partial [Proteus mirabilis]
VWSALPVRLYHAGRGPIVYIGASNAMPREGETVRIKAGIKEHGDYKGTPQTRIARPSRITA